MASEMGITRLELPLSHEECESLVCGDALLLSGDIFTMRDAGHARALAALQETGELPFGLFGQALFYAGPTPSAAGRPIGSVGPTTASRMDFATPDLFRAGITAVLGKGHRSEDVRQACIENSCVYLCAVGGAAALLAKHVVEATPVAWDDLGTEALVRLTLDEFPAFVAIDTQGRDLYGEIANGRSL